VLLYNFLFVPPRSTPASSASASAFMNVQYRQTHLDWQGEKKRKEKASRSLWDIGPRLNTRSMHESESTAHVIGHITVVHKQTDNECSQKQKM
jgi:hypothetical protein